MNRPIKILAVDDDPALLRTLRLLLTLEGMTVTTAGDGQEALERLASDDFDLAVVDLQMPRIDGRELCRQMQIRGDATPVLILSAYGAQAAARELNASGFMGKPYDTALLVETIKDLVAGRSR